MTDTILPRIAVVYLEAEEQAAMGADGPGKVMVCTRTIPYQLADHKNGSRLYFRLPIKRGVSIVLHACCNSSGDLCVNCTPLDLTPLPRRIDGIEDARELHHNASEGAGMATCRRDVEIKIIDAMLRAGEDYWADTFQNTNGSYRPLLVPHAHAPAKVRELAGDSRKKAAQYLKKTLSLCAAYMAALKNGTDDRQLILDVLASEGVTGIKTKRDLNKYLTRLGLPSLREALRS